MSVEYAIIVKNKTRLESLIERFNTLAQARFYIERQGGVFEDYMTEHETFHQALQSLQTQLSRVVKHKIVERVFVPSYLFSEKNVIVVIGQDGLVANTAKYSKGIPIVAVNPDKQRYDGVLLPFDVSNFMEGIDKVLSNLYASQIRRFAEARLNDGQRLLAFNDLFIGAATHVSARYKISYNNQTEEQSSSGLIVSTPAGSTGWLSSVFNMAYGLLDSDSKQNMDRKKRSKQFHIPNDALFFAVREPFKSVRTQIGITNGQIYRNLPLIIESLMPNTGVIFSDGIETDFLRFVSGSIATIGLSNETANLVIKS